MSRAALIGYYGRGNLGDELMLICLSQWLKPQNIEITVIADQAANVAQQHGLPAVQNYPFLGQYSWVEALLRGKAWRTFSALRRCDLVLCGGGDVIRDGVGWRTFTFQVEKLFVALLLGKPVYLLNVGLSRPVTRYGRFTLKWLLPRCRGIVVRDTRSFEMCREFAATSHLKLLPDIVRSLAPLFPAAVRAAAAPKSTILIALHGDSNVYGRYEMTEARIETFAELLDSLMDRFGVNIEFFPFQPGEDGGDAVMARRVAERMRHSEGVRILDWTIQLPEIAARFLRAQLVIAMRLHAAVLAATFAIPCVLMPYDEKVVEFGRQTQISGSLTPDILDQPSLALDLLLNSLERNVPPAALDSSGDWTRFALSAL